VMAGEWSGGEPRLPHPSLRQCPRIQRFVPFPVSLNTERHAVVASVEARKLYSLRPECETIHWSSDSNDQFTSVCWIFTKLCTAYHTLIR
jgi:hypothetical protein